MNVGSKYGCLTIVGLEGEHIVCQCECGKVRRFNIETVEAAPKYCCYPVFISERMTYSVKAQNATYRKKMAYANRQDAILVSERSRCQPSDEYCEIWNQHKRKQMSKSPSSSGKKRYTIQEWNDSGKECGSYEVYATSHLEALKTVYPGKLFELCAQSDIRNYLKVCGKDYQFRVSNHYGNSAQNRTRLYRRAE